MQTRSRRSAIFGPLILASLFVLASACGSFVSPPLVRSFPSEVEKPKPEVVSSRVLTERGGHVDWCAAKNVIAYAHEDPRNISEIYTVEASGKNSRCITCKNKILLKGWKRGLGGDRGRPYRAAPVWHPSCEFMAIEIGNEHFKATRHERAPFGVNHSLWLIAADGSWAEEIIPTEKLAAATRARFSETGDRLFWSARKATGQTTEQTIFNRTPGAENPWEGWYLSIADFERPPGGPAVVSNRVDLYPKEGGWFGATALTGDTIWFSHSAGGREIVETLYRAKADGSKRKKVLDAKNIWEDQGEPSPWGSLLTYRSSRPYGWGYMRKNGLRFDLWALTRERKHVALTKNNSSDSPKRVILEDYAWSPDGREIAVFTRTYQIGVKPRRSIEILRLNDAF